MAMKAANSNKTQAGKTPAGKTPSGNTPSGKTPSGKTPSGKTDGQQPESLATFAAAARQGGKKPDDVGLVATRETAPIPTASKAKDKAATKILQRGVTGKDGGADKAANALPDRTRKGAKGTAAGTVKGAAKR